MNVVVHVLIYLLETIFAAGIIGSAIVVLMTLVEDLEVWVERKPKADEDTGAMPMDFHSPHAT